MKKYLFLFALAASSLPVSELFAQQDPQFSQYMFNPLYINPAYAGSRGMMNGALGFRKQWVGFDGAPTTMVLALNTPTKKGKVGIGFEVINDQIGPRSTTGGYLDYAYRLPLGKGKLAFGLGAGIVSYKVNFDKVTYKDAADSYNTLGTISITKPDFKFGIYFNNKKFYTGLSFTHLNQEMYSVTRDTMTFSQKMVPHAFFTIGRAFQISDNVIFSPSIMTRGVASLATTNYDLNLNFRFREVLWLGVSLRSEKSIVAIVQYNITNKFKVGYSYDMTTNRLKSYQSGTHEIVLGFDLNLFQSQVLSPRFF
ncbi:MAG: type IX secretion system membrane protein PorP/SprF [Bacteroidota bacterium]|nr:type IX secretion system membrane protein PorP/SprF [Bacteroidota bacterium]